MKRVINIASKTLVTVSVLLLLGFVAVEQRNRHCVSLKINISHHADASFVTIPEITDILNSSGKVEGKPCREIDVNRLEQLLEARPEIRDAEIYFDQHGVMYVNVEQRTPLLRIFSARGDSYYIDQEGHFMPLSPHYTARVPVATGDIRITYPVGTSLENVNAIAENDSLARRSAIDDLFKVARFVRQDTFWSAQTEQLVVNADREIEMIPRLGDHIILLGDGERLEEKFTKLMALYNQGFPEKGWDRYSVINLKFNNQVVCTKKQ